MNTFQKLHYGLNFTRKLANSHEYSFAKKLVSHPMRHYHAAKHFVKSGGLSSADTYFNISKGLNKFNKESLPKYSKAYADLSEGYVINPFEQASKGIRIGSAIANNIGKGIQRNRKTKSKLEKSANVARTGLDIYRDTLNPGFR